MILGFLAAVASAAEGVVDRIAAVVNDEVIALSEVYELGADFIQARCPAPVPACYQEAENEVLDELIKRSLVKAELARLDLAVTNADVDQYIDQAVRDNGLLDRDALRAEVERTGTPWQIYRDQIRDILTVQRFQQTVLLPRVSVADDELVDFYQRTLRDMKGEMEATIDAFGVLLPQGVDEQTVRAFTEPLEAAVEALRSGTTTWAEAVATHDQAGLASAIGGRSYRKGELAAALDTLTFTEPVGSIVGPLPLGPVIAVVRITNREERNRDVRPFDEVKDRLKNQLLQEKVEAEETEWYQRARRQAAVEVLL